MVDQLAAALASGLRPRRDGGAPHLTELAREGVTFEHAYCASPLCGPSRSAMLTGRLPSATGVYDNAAEWPASAADRRARAARGRLRDGARREDALRRARPAARVRGAPDDRRLSRRASTGRPTGGSRRDAAAVVPQHREPASGGRARVGDADRLRRRGRASTLSASSASWRGAATTGRSSSPSRSPTRTIPGRCGLATGTSTRGWTWAEPRRARRRIRTACACARCAASTSGR